MVNVNNVLGHYVTDIRQLTVCTEEHQKREVLIRELIDYLLCGAVHVYKLVHVKLLPVASFQFICTVIRYQNCSDCFEEPPVFYRRINFLAFFVIYV